MVGSTPPAQSISRVLYDLPNFVSASSVRAYHVFYGLFREANGEAQPPTSGASIGCYAVVMSRWKTLLVMGWQKCCFFGSSM